MAGRSNEAAAAMGMAVLLAVAVVAGGNYTLAKEEAKHLYNEKPTTGEAEDKAKSWFGWAKQLVKQIVPGTKEYTREGSEKAGEVGEMKDAAKNSVPDSFESFSDREKTAANERVEDTEAKVMWVKEKAKEKVGDTVDAAKKAVEESYETVKGKAGETLSVAKKVVGNAYCTSKKKKKEDAHDGARGSHVEEL